MEGSLRKKIEEEAKKQARLAGPTIVAILLSFILQPISIVFVGHLKEKAELSGAAVALTFANVTGFSVLMGMASALETLCGQAFGANQKKMLGIYLQRAVVVLLSVSIPISILWFFTSSVLRSLRQDEEISAKAGEFACWLIPSLSAFGLLQCLLRFLVTQNVVLPQMMSSGITVLFHVPACWLMIHKARLGFKGAALATSSSYWLNVALLASYAIISPSCKDSWDGFSKKAFCQIRAFLKLAIPSTLMVCLEFWSFEVLVILAGLLPNPKLETSVMSVSLNTSAVVFMIILGLGFVISTRVSNELGGGNPQAARLAIFVSTVLAISEGLIVGVIMILTRNKLGRAYSNDREVVRNVAAMMPLIALSHFINTIQCVFSGVVRGCGWQKICVFVNLVSYYIVGIPTSVLLAFVFHLRGKGLWIGIICALTVQDLVLVIITLCRNFHRESSRARDEALNNASGTNVLADEINQL